MSLSNLKAPKGASRPKTRVAAAGVRPRQDAGRGGKGQKARSGNMHFEGFEGARCRSSGASEFGFNNIHRASSRRSGRRPRGALRVVDPRLKRRGSCAATGTASSSRRGELKSAVTVKAHRVTAGARAAIEKAAGRSSSSRRRYDAREGEGGAEGRGAGEVGPGGSPAGPPGPPPGRASRGDGMARARSPTCSASRSSGSGSSSPSGCSRSTGSGSTSRRRAWTGSRCARSSRAATCSDAELLLGGASSSSRSSPSGSCRTSRLHHPAAHDGRRPGPREDAEGGELGGARSPSTRATAPSCSRAPGYGIAPTSSRSAPRRASRWSRIAGLPLLTMVSLAAARPSSCGWRADHERGVGNGISLIIFAGIVAASRRRAPHLQGYESPGSQLTELGILVLLASWWWSSPHRLRRARPARIPIQYAKRVSAGSSTRPVHAPAAQVNTAGVIPPIFASSLLLHPGDAIRCHGRGRAYGTATHLGEESRVSRTARLLPRCFWLKMKLQNRLPFQIFPGVFSSIDGYTKKVTNCATTVIVVPVWFDGFKGLLKPVRCAPSEFYIIDPATGFVDGGSDEIFQRLDGSISSPITKRRGSPQPGQPDAGVSGAAQRLRLSRRTLRVHTNQRIA